MKTISIGNQPFVVYDGPVGLAFSGGADSSMLLYVLLKYASGPIHLFTCSSKDRDRSQPYHALKVLSKLLDITARNDVTFNVHFVEKKNKNTIFTSIYTVTKTLNINVLYTAGTSFPEKSDLEKFKVDPELNPTWLYDIRDAEVEKPLYFDNNFIYAPWWNFNKKFISSLYHEYSLTDSLFPLTRSCENPEYATGHCGRCWFCAERYWAFGRLE